MHWEFNILSASLPFRQTIPNVPLVVYGDGDDANWMTPKMVRSTIHLPLISCRCFCSLSLIRRRSGLESFWEYQCLVGVTYVVKYSR